MCLPDDNRGVICVLHVFPSDNGGCDCVLCVLQLITEAVTDNYELCAFQLITEAVTDSVTCVFPPDNGGRSYMLHVFSS